MKMKKHKNCCNIDINYNKDKPGASRIPIDTCLPNIEAFIKDEIISTKTCSCSCCNYRRIMLRAIQDIIKDYRMNMKG